MQTLSRTKLKLFTSLQRKKYRYQHQLFVVEGKKMVQEAYHSNWKVRCLVLRAEVEAGELPAGLLDQVPIYRASDSEFQQLSGQVQSEGMLAVMPFPHPAFGHREEVPRELPRGPAFFLDRIQDPGNLGTIVRTADWFGIRRLICGPGTADVLNPKVLRSSMGSLFHTPITYAASLEAWLEAWPGRVWAADLSGTPLNEVRFGRGDAVLLGNEANGILPALRSQSGIHFVNIPGKGSAESLNVSVAAGILAWELSKAQG